MWTVIVNADLVYEVWPDDRRDPCATILGPEDNNYAILTSHPYPVQFIDGLGMKAAEIIDIGLLSGYIEGFSMTQAEVTSIFLQQILKSYDEWPAEGFQMAQAEVTSIFLQQILKSYDNWPPEGFQMTQAEVTSIMMEKKLVTYTNWPAEGFQMNQAEVTSISLVTP